MTSKERVEAVLNGEKPDYVPVCLFGGIFETRFNDGCTVKEFGTDPKVMAEQSMKFVEKYNQDGFYLLSDMALLPEAYGNKPGFPDEDKLIHITLGDFAIKSAEDFASIEPKDPMEDGRMYMYPETCKILSEECPDQPIGISTPSPITAATLIAEMDDVLEWMMMEPEQLKQGLKALEKTITDWINVSKENGATYTGYLETRNSTDILTEDQYKEFGTPYDDQVINNTTPGIYHIVHICGTNPNFKLAAELYEDKTQGISWWDRGASPSLEKAKKEYGDRFTMMAGIDHTETLLNGTPEEVKAEVKDAIETAAVGGKRMIVAPGCEIAPQTPFENMEAAINAAREYGNYEELE